MGKRGPKPKSNAQRELDGDRKDRFEPECDPADDAPSGRLAMPIRFSEDERKIWREVISSFPAGYFKSADRHLLILYCEHLATIVRAKREMRREPLVVKKATGTPCVNMKLQIIQATTPIVERLARELQMTRATRSAAAADRVDPRSGVRSGTQEQDSRQDGAEEVEGVGALMAPPVH